MTRKQALWAIEKMSIWYPKPGKYNSMKRDEFELISYNHFAYEELKKYIYERKDISVVTAIEEFRQQMDDFACNAKTGEANYIFSVMYDVATDFLDLVIGNFDSELDNLSGFNKTF